MSFFGRIANRIFGRSSYQEASATSGATPTQAGTPPATGSVMGGGAIGGAAAASGAGAAASTVPSMGVPGAPAATTADATITRPAEPVDVEAVLTEMASKKGQTLNWRTSIVDLLKVLDLDSSLDARKELATELGYTGAKDGSAEMNVWLIKAVMRKLAENGGRVPESLRT